MFHFFAAIQLAVPVFNTSSSQYSPNLSQCPLLEIHHFRDTVSGRSTLIKLQAKPFSNQKHFPGTSTATLALQH